MAGALATGCGTNSAPASAVTEWSLETQTVATPAQLPPCNQGHEGNVYYVASTSMLMACSGGQWVPVPLPSGPAGPTGATGATGPTGGAGPATLINVMALSDSSPQCPAGGEEVQVGVDTNGDKTLQPSEVQKTAFVCNGASGGPTGVGPCATDTDCNDDNACTVDFCSSGQCAHSVSPSTTVCRAANGTCDQAEYCTGTGTVCPADAYAGTWFTCRDAVDSCDVPEACTGRSTVCPSDSLQPRGNTCRAASGCALAAMCDGASAACPASPPAPQGTVCNPSQGACDVAEACDGTGLTCPSDALVAAGTVCTGVCGKSGACSGSDATCAVSETCTNPYYQTQACTCGTLFGGIQRCSYCYDWDLICALPAENGATVQVQGADSSTSHQCGAASGTSWYSNSCASGQVFAEWSGQLPQGSYFVYLYGAGTSGMQLQVSVNGTVAGTYQDSGGSGATGNYGGQKFSVGGCGNVDIQLTSTSTMAAGYNAYGSYAATIDFRLDYFGLVATN